MRRIKENVHKHRNTPQSKLIKLLNPIIRGWANYYRTVCSKRTFNRCDHLVYLKLQSWANRRHPNKSGQWKTARYWQAHWRFSSGEQTLSRYSDTPIVRHTKVADCRSPYDGDWVYWASRLGRHPHVNKQVAYLLKRQKGRCAYCQMYFATGDKLEQNHRLPRHQGGSWGIENRQLLHRHCHDRKTAQDGSYQRSDHQQQRVGT